MRVLHGHSSMMSLYYSSPICDVIVSFRLLNGLFLIINIIIIRANEGNSMIYTDEGLD